jgi:hypothetical protein
MAITATVMLGAVIAATGMWSPHRWGMYLDTWGNVVSVSFYGKVVDVAGRPLSGAEVRVGIVSANWAFIFGGASTSRQKNVVLRTDLEGRFQVPTGRGFAVRVEEIRLSGYKFKHTINDGVYYFGGPGVGKRGPHRPDSDNPVTFTMTATNGPNRTSRSRD